MASNIHQIKSRLKSIESTQKITKAMRLVAISKLQKVKGQYLKNQPYSDTLANVMRQVLAHSENINHPMLNNNQVNDKSLLIVFASDMGMAGGYNQNIFKTMMEGTKYQQIIWIGVKGYMRFVDLGYNIQNELIHGDQLDFRQIHDLGQELIEQYKKNKITSINVLYTQYVNAMTYRVKQECILPVKIDKVESVKHKEILFEPSAQSLLDDLIPRYVISELYKSYMSAKTSEQSSRRIAMENATNNAQDLIDELRLQYNKVRQASITQEITEIVSGIARG